MSEHPNPVTQTGSSSSPDHGIGPGSSGGISILVVPAVLDRGGTARYLGLSVSTIAELTATGELRSLKVGRRRLYRRVDLDSWLKRKVEGVA